MKQLLLFAGIAALGFAGTAYARPGMGQGMGNPRAMGAFGNRHAMGEVAPRGVGFRAGPSGRVGYGVGGCPPGLAKKAMPCVPPGLARH